MPLQFRLITVKYRRITLITRLMVLSIFNKYNIMIPEKSKIDSLLQ